MKIGVCINLVDQGLEQKVQEVARHGFTNCQLLSWNPAIWTNQFAEKVKEIFQSYNITITAFWCGWEGPAVWNFYEGPETLGLLPETYRYARMKNLMNGSDFAKLLGVTDVVSHMGFIPENPHDPQYKSLVCALKAVAGYLKSNGQTLLFETGQETPVTMLRCFEDIGLDNLGVNLDPANLILYGKANPVDALDVIGKYVRGVHAKDGLYPVDGRNLGREVRLGQGKVNFPLLIQRLHMLGYKGSLTIEREIEGEQQTKDILMAKEYLENILKDIQ